MQHVQHLVDIATIVAPFLTFAIGVLTVVVLKEQLRLSRDLSARTETLTRELNARTETLTRELSAKTEELTWKLKHADIVQALNTRYDRLWQLRHNPSAVEDAGSFFLRFWSLQLDQFSHWRAGFVPDEDYGTWLRQRRDDHTRNWAFREMDFAQGWQLASNDMATNSAFLVLIDQVMVQGADVSKAMKQARSAL